MDYVLLGQGTVQCLEHLNSLVAGSFVSLEYVHVFKEDCVLVMEKCDCDILLVYSISV